MRIKILKRGYRPVHYLSMLIPLVLLIGCGGTEYKYASSPTSRWHNYLDANERIEEVFGLESVNIGTGGIVTVSIRRWGLMPEKAAPIVKNDTIKVTKANPVGASLATLLTVGIYPIFAPKDAWSTTVGKEQLTRSDESPDYSKATRTGRSQWQELRQARQEWVNMRIGGAEIQRVGYIGLNQDPVFNVDVVSWIREQIRIQGGDRVVLQISCNCRTTPSTTSAPQAIRDLRSRVELSIDRNTHAGLFPVLFQTDRKQTDSANSPIRPNPKREKSERFRVPDHLK